MFRKLKRRMLPITLARGLHIVMGLCNPETNTDKWYENAVNHFVRYHENEELLAKDVTAEMVRNWSYSLDVQLSNDGRPYSEGTKNSYRRAIRSFFNKLVEIGHLDPPSPTVKFAIPDPPEGEPRHLDPDEVERIRKYAKRDIRAHAMVEVLYSTGCRISELHTMRKSNLRIEEVAADSLLSDDERAFLKLADEMGVNHLVQKDAVTRFRGKILVIGKGQRGKKKPRWVFLDDTACRAVLAYLKTHPANTGETIWLNAAGRPLAKNSYYHVFKVVARDAGIEARPHDMRHTFAFRLIRNGADVKVVQKMLGHSDPTTTLNIYYKLSDDEMWDAFEDFSG